MSFKIKSMKKCMEMVQFILFPRTLVGSMVRSAAYEREDRGSNFMGNRSGEVRSPLISPILIVSMAILANTRAERKQL